MSTKRKQVCKLEYQCLKRVCRDIVQHSLKYEAESNREFSAYQTFQIVFSNRLLPVLYSISNESCFSRNTTSAFMSCINFVFNPMLEQICLYNSLDFTEEIAMAISANCKKLWLLALFKKNLTSDLNLIFFISMKSLVVLNLHGSSFEGVKLMKAIADSLVNLEVLDLSETNVDDNALFVLCGHQWPSSKVKVSKCVLLKTCDVQCPLKLKRINLVRTTNVKKEGVACLLTHVPTLRLIEIYMISLSTVIFKISKLREEYEMPMLQLELISICHMQHHIEMKQCLMACPKLEKLDVDLKDNCTEVDQVLAEAELPHLKKVRISGNVGRIFNEKLKCFWQKWGPQLTYIYMVGPLSEKHAEIDLDAIRNVLISSPKLQIFVLTHFVSLKEGSVDLFPELPCMQCISLQLSGNADAVNALAYKFVRSFPNITRLGLLFMIKNEILIPCFEFLPCLQTVILMEHAVNKDFVDFLHSKSYKVKKWPFLS